MKIVQVTSEANARPIITNLTRMSADRNIDHGDNSCGTVGAFSEAGVALEAGAAAVDGCDAADGIADGDVANGDVADGGVTEGDAGWA